MEKEELQESDRECLAHYAVLKLAYSDASRSTAITILERSIELVKNSPLLFIGLGS